MRAPFQILAVPYKMVGNEILFCVLKRSDSQYYQFIAGGGEDNENPKEAAIREIAEEIGFNPQTLTELKSMCYVPAEVISEQRRKSWTKDTFVIPEYAFSFELYNDLRLSAEHTEYKWLTYNEARKLLKWDSNKVAMYEINSIIKGK